MARPNKRQRARLRKLEHARIAAIEFEHIDDVLARLSSREDHHSRPDDPSRLGKLRDSYAPVRSYADMADTLGSKDARSGSILSRGGTCHKHQTWGNESGRAVPVNVAPCDIAREVREPRAPRPNALVIPANGSAYRAYRK